MRDQGRFRKEVLRCVQSMTFETEVLGKSDKGLMEVMRIGELET